MPAESQFKVLTSDTVQLSLETQRKTLGFHSSNTLASVYLTALSEVPPEKVWEALAMVRKYVPVPKSPRRNSF